MADDQTPEREIHVNGRIPGGRYFVDIEFEMKTSAHSTSPEKTIEKLHTIQLTRKAESTHQEASQASLGSFQDQVLNHLRDFGDQEWTTTLVAADLGKDPGQVSRVLKKLEGLGMLVSRREGREVFYQAT